MILLNLLISPINILVDYIDPIHIICLLIFFMLNKNGKYRYSSNLEAMTCD